MSEQKSNITLAERIVDIINMSDTLKTFEKEFVEVIVKGAIDVSIYIDELEVYVNDDKVCFGYSECESYLFELWHNTIEVIKVEDDFIELKIDYDGLTTYLEIICHTKDSLFKSPSG